MEFNSSNLRIDGDEKKLKLGRKSLNGFAGKSSLAESLETSFPHAKALMKNTI